MLALALVTALTTAALPQNTWTVDVSNGPGTNFTDLPPAVAAAQNGDIILMRAGAYSSVTISNLAVTIQGVIGLTTITNVTGPAVRVDSQPVGTTTTLSGLLLFGEHGIACDAARLVLLDVHASGAASFAFAGLFAIDSEVHATRCSFHGSDSTMGFPTLVYGGSGAMIYSGSKLFADQCSFLGGNVSYYSQGTSAGGTGLVVEGDAWLTNCDARGGGGYNAGGAGVVCSAGTIHFAGSAASILSGGSGGLLGGYSAYASLGAVVVHGPVPVGLIGGNVTVGASEMPYLSVAGSSLPSGVFDASQPVAIVYEGLLPNAPYFLVAGFAPGYSDAFAPLLLGPLLVDLNNATLTLGTLDGSASFQGSFVPGNLLGALIGVPIYAQAATFDVSAGQFLVSNGTVMRFGM